MGATSITIQVVTSIDGVSRTVPPKTATITHAAEGFINGTIATSDAAAVIPQSGVVPKFAHFENMSAVAGEYIDIMNDTAVLTRLDPAMQACFDVSQVATPASNLKAKAATGKTPVLAYFIIPA